MLHFFLLTHPKGKTPQPLHTRVWWGTTWEAKKRVPHLRRKRWDGGFVPLEARPQDLLPRTLRPHTGLATAQAASTDPQQRAQHFAGPRSQVSAERLWQAGREQEREQSHPLSADDTWRLLLPREQHGSGSPGSRSRDTAGGTGLAAAGSPRSGERRQRRGRAPGRAAPGPLFSGRKQSPGAPCPGALRHKGGGEPPTHAPRGCTAARQERPSFRSHFGHSRTTKGHMPALPRTRRSPPPGRDTPEGRREHPDPPGPSRAHREVPRPGGCGSAARPPRGAPGRSRRQVGSRRGGSGLN